MSREHQRPLLQPAYMFDWLVGSEGPAVAHRLAQETSWALLDRVRHVADPAVVERVLQHAAGDGIDDIAEIWANSGPHSLAGVLWRLYLLRRGAETDAPGTADLFDAGQRAAITIDPVVAGAADPVTPDSIRELCDTLLRGVFTGDFAVALERAASFCRVMSFGATARADDRDAADPTHASQLTVRALRYDTFAHELQGAARRWRDGTLD